MLLPQAWQAWTDYKSSTSLTCAFSGLSASSQSVVPCLPPTPLGSSEAADPEDVLGGGPRRSGEDERDTGHPGKQVREVERAVTALCPYQCFFY